MRFSANLKKYTSGLMLLCAAVLLAGCGEASSTPGKPVTGQRTSTSHVSSSTGPGREVPEAAPATDDADLTLSGEKAAGEKSNGAKPDGE